MKKNIIIAILILIIVILSFKAFNPTVIISKRTAATSAANQSKEVITQTTPETNTVKIETKEQEISSSTDYGAPSFVEENTNIPAKNINNNQYQSDRLPSEKLRVTRASDYYNQNTPAPAPKRIENKLTPAPIVPNNPPRNPQTKLEQNVIMCKPYSESMKAQYMGMLMDYKLYIRGWVDNKCIIDFIATVEGVGDTFNKTYKTDPKDVEIFTFAPTIQCKFTKEQLLYVGDSILQEKEREQGVSNNMLKNPNNVNLPTMQSMSPSDTRLLEVVIGHRACEITNNGDLTKMINDLFE